MENDEEIKNEGGSEEGGESVAGAGEEAKAPEGSVEGSEGQKVDGGSGE